MSTQSSFGITFPAIDDLLQKVVNEDDANSKAAKSLEDGLKGSKFALASFASIRGRQIVNYFSNLQAGMYSDFEVGPLVDYYQNEKPLSIAMREINEGKFNLLAGQNNVQPVVEKTVVDALDSVIDVDFDAPAETDK